MDKEAVPYNQTKKSLISIVKNAALLPPRLVISRPARRAYLTTILLVLAAIALAFISILTYSFFYYTYLPNLSFTLPIHLQFAQKEHPWGIASLEGRGLASAQEYDVEVHMHLPRTPANLAAGNFMLDLSLLAAPDTSKSAAAARDKSTSALMVAAEGAALAQSRRPAILKYRSRLVENAKKAAVMPLYLVGWKEEAEMVDVNMMERVRFARRGVPQNVMLKVESSERMQVYWARVTFTARLGGLRWLMYKHRVMSFVVCTTVFWTIEMTFALTIWLTTSFLFRRRSSGDAPTIKPEPIDHIKAEEDAELTDGMSDTSRTFPTYSRQPPLRYSVPRIKKEEDDEGLTVDTTLPLHPTAAEADIEDEDEDADFVLEERTGRSDSGLGTSMESSGGSLRRRRSKGFRDGGDGLSR